MNKEKTMKFEDIKLKNLQDILNEIMKLMYILMISYLKKQIIRINKK